MRTFHIQTVHQTNHKKIHQDGFYTNSRQIVWQNPVLYGSNYPKLDELVLSLFQFGIPLLFRRISLHVLEPAYVGHTYLGNRWDDYLALIGSVYFLNNYYFFLKSSNTLVLERFINLFFCVVAKCKCLLLAHANVSVHFSTGENFNTERFLKKYYISKKN